jgi:hypothetical protein
VLWEGLFYIQVLADSPLLNHFAMSAYHAWVMQKHGPKAYARLVDAEYRAKARAIAAAEASSTGSRDASSKGRMKLSVTPLGQAITVRGNVELVLQAIAYLMAGPGMAEIIYSDLVEQRSQVTLQSLILGTNRTEAMAMAIERSAALTLGEGLRTTYAGSSVRVAHPFQYIRGWSKVGNNPFP